MERATHTIDATGKILGRLASEIAQLLRGKGKVAFAPNVDAGDFVVVTNVEKIQVTGKKMTDKVYYRHSGYLGGIKEETLGEVFSKDPGEPLRRAVEGMLPGNKLAPAQLKRLTTLVGEKGKK